MKKLALMLMFVLFVVSCNGNVDVIKPIVPCKVDKPDGTVIELQVYCQEIKEAGRVSHICNLMDEYEFDACYIHRGMEVISKEGLILEGYTFEQFEAWANWLKEKVEAGMTYALLKDLVIAKFTEMNKMIGAQILILGDMFLQLPQDEFILEDDKIMIISSINDLVEEVKRLDIWIN